MPTVTIETLLTRVAERFHAAGVPREEAQIVAEHLVDAEACGVTSHGLSRVSQYLQAIAEGQVDAAAKLAVQRESGCTAVLDGQRGFGVVMALRAMDRAIQLARRFGVGAVTLRNCGHTGRIGTYTERAAREGMGALVMVNSGGHGQWVAPFGGMAGRLSTNPLSIAVPNGSEDPVVLDIATSMAPEGRVRALRALGKSLPEGWAIDGHGQPTTNPSDLYGSPRGALLPVGDHKGYGLAFLIDALAGGLSGAGCCAPDSEDRPPTDGVFLLAVNVSAFRPLEEFSAEIRRLAAHVQSAPAASGFAEILVPGQTEAKARRERRRDGVPVDEAIWKLL